MWVIRKVNDKRARARSERVAGKTGGVLSDEELEEANNSLSTSNYGAGVSVSERGSGAHPRHERQWGDSSTSSGQAAQNLDRKGYHESLGSRAHKSYQQRLSDYLDEDNTAIENIGNFLASNIGFNEVEPSFSENNFETRANWGWDPVVGIGAVVSTLAGLPLGTTSVINKVSKWAGRPAEITLGPSVFGDPIPGSAKDNLKVGVKRNGLISFPPEKNSSVKNRIQKIESKRPEDILYPTANSDEEIPLIQRLRGLGTANTRRAIYGAVI